MITNIKDSLSWKGFEYLTYVFLATFPFINYLSFLYYPTTTRALNTIILGTIAAIVLSFLFFNKKNKISLSLSPVMASLFLYFVVLFFAGLFGLSFSNSFWSVATRMTGLWYFLSLGLILFVWWPIFEKEKTHRNLVLTIVGSTAIYSVLSLFGPEGLGLLFKGYLNDGFTFGNSTFAAMYLFGAFILSLYYLFTAEARKWWMYVLPFTLVINPYIINSKIFLGDFSKGLVGEARASAYVICLSLVALFGVWCVSKIKSLNLRAKISYGLFGLGIIMAGTAAFSLLVPGGILRSLYLNQATGARPLVWEMSEQVISEKLLLGWGSDNFERVFETHYDNRLLQSEYGNEAWFDRAHNIFVDQMVDAGLIGVSVYLLVYIIIIGFLVYAGLYNNQKNDRLFAGFAIVYFTLHLAELQTAFDTSISYIMLAFMFVSSALIIHRTFVQNGSVTKITYDLPEYLKYVAGFSLLIFASSSFIFGVIPFIQSQITNGTLRTIGSSADRIPLYSDLFASQVDKHAILWRTSTDFQRGIAQNPRVLESSEKVNNLIKEWAIVENEYRKYVAENPNHFRAKLNFADVLIYSMLFGVNKLEEAQQVLDDAIAIAPESPQPYWMKAVAYVYMQKFDLAKEYAQKALVLNPRIQQSQDVVEYVNDSIRTFPEIDLFFFSQT